MQTKLNSKSKAALSTIALVVFLSNAEISSAAEHYVRAGATGAGNGSDWINAWTSLPPTLARGDTYYIADGAYAGYTFDDVSSGEQLITIKKATNTQHGTETGWQSSYGTGQAEFGPLSFTTSHWLLDGQVRATNKTGYGFYIYTGTAVSPSNKGIRLNGSGDIVIRYAEIAGHGPDDDGGGNDLIYASQPVSNVTVQYCFLRDAGRAHLVSRGGNNWTLEHSVMLRDESTSSEHSESWSPGRTSDVIVRYNLYEEIQGTGILATLDNLSGPDNWEIYGNIFYNSTPSGGVVTTDAESGWTNVKFYNNTIASVANAGIHVDNGDTTGWQIYNNLWYNSTGVTFASDQSIFDHDYNWFYPATGTGGDAGEAHGQAGMGNPFVNIAGYNFQLLSSTHAGTTLSIPYNADPNDVARGIDGVWDRGAYEYISGLADNIPPVTPNGLAVQ